MKKSTVRMIQEVLNLIEGEIERDITIEELAEACHYSPSHFMAVFQDAVGLPVVQYLTRRKLVHAIYHVQLGETITDMALRYGFFTHSGFYKAFTKEYGMSPTTYMKISKTIKPVPPNILNDWHKMYHRGKLKK